MQAGVEAAADEDQPLNRMQVPGLARGSRGDVVLSCEAYLAHALMYWPHHNTLHVLNLKSPHAWAHANSVPAAWQIVLPLLLTCDS